MRQAVVDYPCIELLALVLQEVEQEVWVGVAGGLNDRVDVGA